METLKALVPLVIALAVIFASGTILFAVVAATFFRLDVDLGGKWLTLKLRKASKPTLATDLPTPIAPTQELPEGAGSANQALAHLPVPQQITDCESEKESAEATSSKVFFNYLRAKTISDLDIAWDAFTKECLTEEAPEFWHTENLRRRADLGAERGRDALRDLAAAQPTWAHPHSTLLNWAIDDHDIEAANRHFAEGLKRSSSPQFGHVLSAGITLRFKTDGKEAALQLACEWSKADLTEAIRAGAFVTLADLLKESGDADGYRTALEFANLIQPSIDDRLFKLAYAYADAGRGWAPAVYHYQRLVGSEDDGPVSRNNVGIIYADLDKAVAVQTYEAAARDGDKYASANLAHLLINDGYIAIAQKLLAEVDDPGAAAENHAAAKKAVLTARRHTEDKLEEITAKAKAEVEPLKASFAAALRNRQQADFVVPAGPYASADHNVLAVINDESALCQLRVGNLVYTGNLQNQATCFAGYLSVKGSSLLGSEIGQFIMLDEGKGNLRLYRWPSKIGLGQGITSYELRQVTELPQLAPSPPSPSSHGLLAAALALGVNKASQ